MKKKKHPFKAFTIASVATIALLATATALSTTVFYDILNIVMPGGGARPVFGSENNNLYKSDFATKEEAYENGKKTNIEICEEGMTLLKNKDSALPIKTPESDTTVSAKPKISVFGKNSVNLAYSGSGSGAANSGAAVDLYSALAQAGYEYNPVLKEFYDDASASGEPRKANSSDLDSGSSVVLSTGETPQSKYTQKVKDSYSSYADAAIVTFTRVGGEGFDLPRSMKGAEGANDPDDTFLELDKNERELLHEVCNAGFKKVIVLLNSASAMEVTFLEDTAYFEDADKIDACLFMGFPGLNGTIAVGEILSGKINPSGHTVDTYVANLKDAPSFKNFGDNNLEGGDQYHVDGNKQSYYFVNYEEDIYVGYKYYETRGKDDEAWYQSNVVYPFGYGLSYTSFTREYVTSNIENTAISAKDKYSVTVKVTNSGAVAGKDVVQLYGHAPYIDGGIEKAEETLVGFAKTNLLEPGESQTLTIDFDPYYLASYDYLDKNGNGFKGYELEAANGYKLTLNSDAHTSFASIPFEVANDIKFQTDPVTKNKVQNLFTGNKNPYFDSNLMLKNLLSRKDWTGTYPKTPTESDRNVDSKFIQALNDVNHNNPEDLDEFDMPWFDEKVTITLRDMLRYDEEGNERKEGETKVDYNDTRWDTLLEECNADELVKMISYGAFKSNALLSIEKPLTNDTDGPAGFVNFMDPTTYYGTCSYASEVLLGSTWNTELAEEFGQAVGNEGIFGDSQNKSNGMPYSGWYAPGMNIHRSPFGGRTCEYYSEDAFLSGKMAAAQIKGCKQKGVYCFMKHFALNEQETHRSINGDCSWVSEQAMREIYLRPFEIAVKEADPTGVMSSFNRIGTRWTGGDYRLLTSILREEWGFKGTVICDFNTSGEYMNQKQMAYAGGDLNLSATPKTWVDTSDSEDAVILARCAKNIIYTVVNSNAMNKQIVGYALPYWTVCVIVLDCVALAGFATWFIIILIKRKKNR